MKRTTYKGSSLIIIIIFMAVLFTLSAGIIELTVSSIRQSNSYYSKNKAYYDTESVLERIIFYLDQMAEDARKKTNDYFFTPSGALNTNNGDINDLYTPKGIYNYYLTQTVAYDSYLHDGIYTQQQYDQALSNIQSWYANRIRDAFVKEYKNYIKKFFNNQSDSPVFEVVYNTNNISIDSWNDLKDFLDNIEFNIPNIQISYTNLSNSPSNIDYHFGSIDPIDINLEVQVINLSDKTKRALISKINILPFKDQNLVFSQKSIKRGFNGILDYTLYSGRNIFVANGGKKLIIKGDILAKSTYNNVDSQYSSDKFGGLIVGLDQNTIDNLNYADNNKIDANSQNYLNNIISSTSTVSGNIYIDGNIYLGYPIITYPSSSEDWIRYSILGGFIRTIANNSTITVTNNVYCHSIVTEETSQNSIINIGGNAYIADNLSMYAKNSKIDIGGSLIGFEDAQSDTNYNSSPSIVINEDTAQLNIARNVVLFGVAFVDNVNDHNNKLFRTAESSSLLPNFLIYQYFKGVNSTELNNLGFTDNDTNSIFNASYYTNYKIRDNASGTDDNISLYDIKEAGPDNATSFVLHYLAAHSIDADNYDMEYNYGDNISVGGGNISVDPNDIYNTSYFNFLFNANGKIYLSRNIYIPNLNYIKTKLGDKFVDLSSNINATFINNLKNNLIFPIKKALIDKLNLRGKGNITNDPNQVDFELNDFVDFNALSSDTLTIFDTTLKKLIIISKNDIDIDIGSYQGLLNGLNDYSVLLVSKKNINIKNSLSGTVKLYGNIIAGGDIIFSGNGDIEINYNKQKSGELMNYYSLDSNVLKKLGQLYNFFIKGVDFNNMIEIPFLTSPEKVTKSNIKVIYRRQLIK
ncbi:hypothetical protein ACAG39_03090 [Caldicellulosiruptoraceae bacterium PP1]